MGNIFDFIAVCISGAFLGYGLGMLSTWRVKA